MEATTSGAAGMSHSSTESLSEFIGSSLESYTDMSRSNSLASLTSFNVPVFGTNAGPGPRTSALDIDLNEIFADYFIMNDFESLEDLKQQNAPGRHSMTPSYLDSPRSSFTDDRADCPEPVSPGYGTRGRTRARGGAEPDMWDFDIDPTQRSSRGSSDAQPPPLPPPVSTRGSSSSSSSSGNGRPPKAAPSKPRLEPSGFAGISAISGGGPGGSLTTVKTETLHAKKRRRRPDPRSMTDDQRVERRERNREHAKRSRIRKKFLLEALQDQLTGLRQDNTGLRGLLLVHLPGKAGDILKECMAEESFLMLDSDMRLAAEETNRRGGCGSGGGFVGFGSTGGDGVGSSSSSSGGGGRPDEGGQGTKVGLPGRCGESGASSLHGPDYRLMASLVNAQQNFAVSDPSLPDNPIVYASDGFLTLTGYSREQVLGRNCRFLQGPDTDQRMVDVIRRGVAKGEDTSVCLLNYKADGTTFWNQFFVAALKDYQGNIVNYVGVQCQVENFIEAVSTAEKNST